MERYLKKPDQFEAVEVLDLGTDTEPYTFNEAPDWLRQAIFDGRVVADPTEDGKWGYAVKLTKEGYIKYPNGIVGEAGPGDYLIWNVRGGVSVASKDEFADTFEAVTS